MPQFVFRFQPVLSLKKQLEDNMKNELGKAIKKFEYEKEELVRIENDQQECLKEMQQYASKSIDVNRIREYNSFLLHLRENLKIQKDNLDEAKDQVENCRGELVEAVKERETLDRLRERHLGEYHRQQNAKEQKHNDEVAGYAYNKRMLHKS